MRNGCPWYLDHWRVILGFLVSGMIVGTTSLFLKSVHRHNASSRINEMVCLRITRGMSPDQVSELIGCPSGSYNASPILLKIPDCSWSQLIWEQYDSEVWTGDEGEIIVCFRAGVVHRKFYRHVIIEKRSMIEHLWPSKTPSWRLWRRW